MFFSLMKIGSMKNRSQYILVTYLKLEVNNFGLGLGYKNSFSQ